MTYATVILVLILGQTPNPPTNDFFSSSVSTTGLAQEPTINRYEHSGLGGQGATKFDAREDVSLVKKLGAGDNDIRVIYIVIAIIATIGGIGLFLYRPRKRKQSTQSDLFNQAGVGLATPPSQRPGRFGTYSRDLSGEYENDEPLLAEDDPLVKEVTSVGGELTFEQLKSIAVAWQILDLVGRGYWFGSSNGDMAKLAGDNRLELGRLLEGHGVIRTAYGTGSGMHLKVFGLVSGDAFVDGWRVENGTQVSPRVLKSSPNARGLEAYLSHRALERIGTLNQLYASGFDEGTAEVVAFGLAQTMRNDLEAAIARAQDLTSKDRDVYAEIARTLMKRIHHLHEALTRDGILGRWLEDGRTDRLERSIQSDSISEELVVPGSRSEKHGWYLPAISVQFVARAGFVQWIEDAASLKRLQELDVAPVIIERLRWMARDLHGRWNSNEGGTDFTQSRRQLACKWANLVYEARTKSIRAAVDRFQFSRERRLAWDKLVQDATIDLERFGIHRPHFSDMAMRLLPFDVHREEYPDSDIDSARPTCIRVRLVKRHNEFEAESHDILVPRTPTSLETPLLSALRIVKPKHPMNDQVAKSLEALKNQIGDMESEAESGNTIQDVRSYWRALTRFLQACGDARIFVRPHPDNERLITDCRRALERYGVELRVYGRGPDSWFRQAGTNELHGMPAFVKNGEVLIPGTRYSDELPTTSSHRSC